MTRLLQLSTVWFLLAATSLLRAAPAPLRTPPLALSISLDRKEYLLREPILLEWALANVTTYRVHYFAPDFRPVFYLERLGGRSQKRMLVDGVKVCVEGPRPLTTLQPKRAARVWDCLRSYDGLYGLGKFKLWAECRVACCATVGDKPVLFNLKSNEVIFRVGEAKGADAEAIALIDRTMLKGFEDVTDEHRREDQCNRWLRGPEVREAVLAQKGSSRFRAAAAYQLGRWTRPAPGDDVSVEEFGASQLRQAVPYFKACVVSEGASLYLKGLAEAELLDLTAMEKGKTHPQALKMAKSICARYPKTLMADRAQALIDEAARKKK